MELSQEHKQTYGKSSQQTAGAEPAADPVFWRVEGSLLNLTAVRPVAFFAWNAQSFLERWTRRGAMGILAVARPFLYATNRIFATRLLHTILRGVSKDRLDLLGEEYFQYRLRPRLKQRGVEKLRQALAGGNRVVLVSQGLDHIMRPLAEYLGIQELISNRLEFRDGLATGRLLEPVIRPRGAFAKLTRHNPDGRISPKRLARDLGFPDSAEYLDTAIRPARRSIAALNLPVVHYNQIARTQRLSVRESLRGKQILLIGGTGFIGKVWLANLLNDLPDIGKVFLLIRSNRSSSALARFQRIVEESPVFGRLAQKHGTGFAKYLCHAIEVVEGDVTKPGLGLAAADHKRLVQSLDLIVNSSGLTEFNPDLREALAVNVRAVANVLEFLRQSNHAALLHLSTCYAVGMRDGRILENLEANYTPAAIPGYDAERELQSLDNLIRETEARSETDGVTEELRRQALAKRTAAKDLHGTALENQIRKNRMRWLRQALTDAGTTRANELGWPNTYTLTKGLAESLVKKFLDSNPGRAIAVVRPSIVESSVEKPLPGWNEGINTSASLSYLLGTYFRQLPTNERKRLDLIPVDLVTRGMTLISAALLERAHAPLYQLATSVANPCDMRRSIELTGLGHRKYYRAHNGFNHRLRSRFDAIPVSKARYEKLSAPAQKAIVQAINRSIEPILFSRAPLARRERELERIIKLIELFEPFILHNDHVFEAANVEQLSAALPPEELAEFGYDPRAIDWWEYWINVHIPALRKWCYPLIEGRRPEAPPSRSVPLGSVSEAAAASSRSAASS